MWRDCAGCPNRLRAHYPELDVDLLLTAAMLHDVGKLDEFCYERSVAYTTEGQLLGHIVMELETVAKAMEEIEGFPAKLKAVVQHMLISHHGQYEFGSPKLPMIREALVFHYLDDMDSKVAAVRAAMAIESGEEDWSAYSGALGRKFLRLERYLADATGRNCEEGRKALTATIHNSPSGRATSWGGASAPVDATYSAMIPTEYRVRDLCIRPATVLAPMAGVTDTLFRRVIRGTGRLRIADDGVHQFRGHYAQREERRSGISTSRRMSTRLPRSCLARIHR